MTTAERFLADEAVEVAPGAIEPELRRVWQASANEENGSARATMMTLVGHAATTEALTRLKVLFDEASERLPSRIVLMQTDTDGPDGLRAWIATNFHQAAHGARHIYSEEVTLQASGAAVAHLPSLVRSLRVADVPAVLYWPGPLPEDRDALASLMACVDRVVVDTHDFEEPSELARFAGLLPAGPHASAPSAVIPFAIADLDWLRIAPWQALIAHMLDGDGPSGVPGSGPVHHLDRVVVEHGDRASCDAYLLCGWLMSRLGWSLVSPWEVEGIGSAWRLLRPDGEPVVIWIRRADQARKGLLMAHLEASRSLAPMALTIRRMDDDLEVRGTHLAPTRRVVPWPADRELLGRALRSPEGDRVFGEALRAAAILIGSAVR